MNTIINDFLLAIDGVGAQFVGSLYTVLSNRFAGLLTGMLLVYVIWWGYSIIVGTSSLSPLEAAERLAKAAFIFWIATNWGVFSTSLYQMVQYIPVALSKEIVGLVNDTPTTVGVIPEMFNQLYTQMLVLVAQIYNGTLQDQFAGLLSTVIIIITLLFLGAALSAIIIAKVMLNILLALGPVWIALALYRFSSRFTAGFLTATVNLMVQHVLIYGFLGFYYPLVMLAIGMAENGTTDASVVQSKLSYVMPLLLVMTAGTYVLVRIPFLATLIAGKVMNDDARLSATVAGSIRGAWRHLGTATAATIPSSTLRERNAMRASIAKETRRNASVAFR